MYVLKNLTTFVAFAVGACICFYGIFGLLTGKGRKRKEATDYSANKQR